MEAPNRGRCCATKLPTYLGFAILGLVNVLVPFIVHSANYLIIPYPRWIVVLIETLPALLTKLVIPHLLHHVPYWMRPLTVGGCWITVAIFTKLTPPNMAPPLRIFSSVLASVAAAAMEVSFLGMMRYYGRASLAGWGAGVGVGAVFCAVLPFILTVRMESFLRSFIDCIYVLTGAMLMAFFVILPAPPVNYPDTRHDLGKVDIEDSRDGSLLIQDPVRELSRMLSTKNRINLTRSMVRPFMVPLFAAFAAQALAYPGISRALPLPSTSGSFFSYYTSYGLAFQLGSFISGTYTPLFRPRIARLACTVLGVVTVAMLINAMLILFSSQVLVRLLAFGAGLGGGAIYMSVLDNILEGKSLEPGINQEFSLQMVGAGKTAGDLCDEQGPPCANCAVRGLEGCSYLADPPAQMPATETRRRIELELMYRWSTSTYKSLVSIPADGQWLQEDIPRWGLKHEYLLHGMFAFSALEIALCGNGVMEDDPAVWVRLALEYYDKASRPFRAQLENVTDDNVQEIFMFSFFAVGINTALAQCTHIIALDEQQDILERMVALWELLMGNASIANQHFEALVSGVVSRSTDALMSMTQLTIETPTSISPETEAALERLSIVVERTAHASRSANDEARSDEAVRIDSFRAGVAAIRTCFLEDSKDLFKGICIAFPAMVGREFGVALKESDPVAMFLMMHWGVQLHSLGKMAWWVGSFGQKMVHELSEMLGELGPGTEVAMMSEWRENIAWARTEVELSPLGVVTPEE
ncbi:hypothetical protein FZEAL_1511 [Fusarium zealandicum]|uniref:Uncharacterized protein n=1 Tax=Fusarium zealandicum TaxID=1053134 RepID=A0A8H4XPE2_9HYPO|nr:hypothetical protein FZEAL_1511 [Fusarium zealandicum]